MVMSQFAAAKVRCGRSEATIIAVMASPVGGCEVGLFNWLHIKDCS